MAKRQSVDNDTQAETITRADQSERELARQAAKAAVSTFYAGDSLPFKAAVDLRYRSPVHNTRKNATGDNTPRSAAGIAAIITYCDVQPDGTFVRGSGRVPGRLIGRTGADANKTYNVGPESGLLTQLYSGPLHRLTHVSGPLHGIGAELATYQLDFDACRACMLHHNSERPDGSKTGNFDEPLRLLSLLEKRASEATTTETNNPNDAPLEPDEDPPPGPLADLIPIIDESHIGGDQGEHDGKASRLGFGGQDESDGHKRLKEYIANNPDRIGMVQIGKTEHKFESYDEADVYFHHRRKPCVVEVKSYISVDADLKRGIYQCVKYRALAKAECHARGEAVDSVETALVIQRQLPADLDKLAQMFRIRVVVVNRADVPAGEEPFPPSS
jgi:hypothetical protein